MFPVALAGLTAILLLRGRSSQSAFRANRGIILNWEDWDFFVALALKQGPADSTAGRKP